MDENSHISIIIPVYNVRPYLGEALDSVLGQRYGNLEIIVIDDGSTDGSGAICDDYAARDPRVTVLHQANRGLSAARNMGLDRMTGAAVAFLDPDDAYDPRYVETMWRAMLAGRADMVVSRFTVHATVEALSRKGDETAMPSIGPGRYDRLEALRALADWKINNSVWNKLYRRELWSDLRFPEGHVYEDIDVTYRVVGRCDTICVVDQPLYLHRKRPGSITDTVSPENIRDLELAHSHYARFVGENTPGIFTPGQRKRVQSGQLNSLIGQYVRCYGKAGIDCEGLRARTIALGIDIGASNLRLRTRIAYGMLRTCPWLLRRLYPVYQTVRQLVHRLFVRQTG